MSCHELGTDSHSMEGITPYFRVTVTHAERGRGGTSPPTSSTWSRRHSPTGELRSAALSGCSRAQSEDKQCSRIKQTNKKKNWLSQAHKYTHVKRQPSPCHITHICFSCTQQMINTSTFIYTCKLFCELPERMRSLFILPPHHTPREVCQPCSFFMQQCLIL